MNIFRKIGKKLSSPASQSGQVISFFVQCSKCGEKLRTRVDVVYDLTPEYDGDSDFPTSYHCRKVLIGENKCYQPIEVRLSFNQSKKLAGKEISGGKFIDEAAFSA